MSSRAEIPAVDLPSTITAGHGLGTSLLLLLTFPVTSSNTAGTQAFNEELGRMTLVSYPMIAIPSMLMMIAIFFYLWRTIRRLTGHTLEEVIAPGAGGQDKGSD